LPDFWLIFSGLGVENFGIFYGHLAYFVIIWQMLWPFGAFYWRLVYFFPFLVYSTEENLATLS
jgi:hypothetical protein